MQFFDVAVGRIIDWWQWGMIIAHALDPFALICMTVFATMVATAFSWSLPQVNPFARTFYALLITAGLMTVFLAVSQISPVFVNAADLVRSQQVQ